jgi:hypothetical protein
MIFMDTDTVPVRTAMTGDRTAHLQPMLDAIQARWGSGALQKLSALPAASARLRLATGFPALDALLDGGVPCSAITELAGQPTSGAATVAMAVIANAQEPEPLAAVIDPARTFDADCAVRCGVTLDRLLLVQPARTDVALHILADLITYDVFSVLLVDATSAGPLSQNALQRVRHLLRKSPAVALFLTRSQGTLSECADLRLGFERAEWLHQGQDISGYTSRVTLLHDKRGQPGRQTTLMILLGDAEEHQRDSLHSDSDLRRVGRTA